MVPVRIDNSQTSLYFLSHTLNQKDPLYTLADAINRQLFEDAFLPLYCKYNGRPARPIRLMTGLTYTQFVRRGYFRAMHEEWMLKAQEKILL